VSKAPLAVKKLLHRDDSLENAVAERIETKTRLGVTAGEVSLAAKATWGRTFLEERDRRVIERPGDVRAIRGRVTRELEKELIGAIEQAANNAAVERQDQ
jgi:hypothetical protein